MQDLENYRLNHRAGEMEDNSFARLCIFQSCDVVRHFPGPASSKYCYLVGGTGGKEGLLPPRCPQNTFLTKNSAKFLLFFCPEPCSGG